MRRIVMAVFGIAVALPAQFPDFRPPTELIGATLRNDTAEVKRLLAGGVSPNEGRFLGIPAIIIALGHNNRAVVEAMIEKGADVKVTDGAGSTTLMWAAYNEKGDPTLVEMLLKLGVDPNAKNKNGETALTWALRRGHTPVVEALKRAGTSDREMVKQSVEKATTLLFKSSPQFVKVSGCASCHNQSLPLMAASMARQHGFDVDVPGAQYQGKATMAMYRPITAQMADDKIVIPNPPISVGYALVALAADGYAPDATTDAMAQTIAHQQGPEGAFHVLPMRPPLEASTFTGTALSIRALEAYGKDSEPRIQRAREWLETATPQCTEDRAMQLLGLTWAKADVEHLRDSAAALLAEQRPEGGWAQLPGVESDAYATGQALVALWSSGQLAASDAAFQRGITYLLRTQFDDGSWLVRSRSTPFQPYKESGFPHGRHQWISAAGTSWAVMALSLTQPVVKPEISRLVHTETQNQ